MIIYIYIYIQQYLPTAGPREYPNRVPHQGKIGNESLRGVLQKLWGSTPSWCHTAATVSFDLLVYN